MRVLLDSEGMPVGITLSKRNLLALLHKVDDPASARCVYKGNFAVRVEPDDVHYQQDTPGRMSAATEAFIQEFTK